MHISLSRRFLALLLLPLLCIVARAGAQNTFAALHGTVTDSSGAVIPNAEVVALNDSTGISTQTKTDGKGYYIFPQLAPSTFREGQATTYTITVTANGFQQFQSKGLVLNLNDNRDVDAVMQVGTSAQTVQVQASAVQVQTSDTQLSTEVDASEIEDMPLLGRDVVQLQKTTPGVAEMSDRFGTFSTDGSQTPQNSFMLDGIDINDGPLQQAGVTPSPDALAEVNFIDSTLNPEFSRNSGMTVNESIKNGTNSIHGDGFEFYRDTFLTNGNYFSPIRPVFHQNLFGGTLGGPIIKNKLFAFLSYQGLRNVAATTQITQVFGATTQLAGNFTSDLNEATGTDSAGLSNNPIPFSFGSCTAGEKWSSCFPAGSSVVIPSSDWNSISAHLTSQFVPAANYSLGGQPAYDFNSLNTAGDDQGIVRLDYHPTNADAIWFSTLFESNPTFATLPFDGADLPGFPEDNAAHTKIFNASYTHTFTPNVLNELRLGYYRFVYAAVEPASGNVSPASFGFSINPQDAKAEGLPVVGLGENLFTLGFSADGPQPRNDQNMTAGDNFTWVKGSHNIKVGAHIEKFIVDNPFYFLNNGDYTMAGSGPYSSGDPAIDFLMGIPDGYEQTSGGIIDAHSWELYSYAQDNWKVSSNVTFNYGLAWDTETPNANGQWGGLGISCWQNSSATTSKFAPVAGTALPPGLLFPGDPGCSSYGGTHIRWANVGPRVGIAWSPESGPKAIIGEGGRHDFSVRAGFGVYYNRDQEEESLQNLLDPPFALESLGASGFGGVPSFANPYADVAGNGSEPNSFPFAPAKAGAAVNFENYFPDNLSNVTSSYRPPYTYNFNLNIQRALPGNMVFQLGYVGSLAHDLPRELEGDPITAAGHAACAANATCIADRSLQHEYFPTDALQPATIPGTALPWYVSIGNQVSDGASNYNSLQVQLTKAASHGLYFQLAYTYAHALDDASGYESSSGAKGVTTNFVPGYEYLNYGDSDYDFRQRLVATYNWRVPIGSLQHNRIINEAIGGWHLTGITAVQSGFPITFSETGVYNSLWCDGQSYYGCPDVPEVSSFNIQKLNPRSASHEYFSSSNFSAEPIGTFGNAKRNFFHGPGYNYSDMTVYKDFPFASEARYVELRLEGYNTFNHANFAAPSGNFSAGPGFNTVSSVDQNGTSDPEPGRAVQLVGKIYF